MDTLNEKLLKIYEDNIVNKNIDTLVEQYLSALDSVESVGNEIDEKWAKKVEIQHTGEHAGKSVAQLKKEIEALKGKPGNKEKMGELLFALRAKTGWKKGQGAAGLPKGNK
jgi:hypothetical protein